MKNLLSLLTICFAMLLLCVSGSAQGGAAEKPPSVSPAKPKGGAPAKKAAPSRKTPTPKVSRSNNTRSRSNDNQKTDSRSVEVEYWGTIKDSTDPEDFRIYLKKYPNGEFVDLAQKKIRDLEAASHESEKTRVNREATNKEEVDRGASGSVGRSETGNSGKKPDLTTDMDLIIGLPQRRGTQWVVALRNTGSVDANVAVVATTETCERLTVHANIPARDFGEAVFTTHSQIVRVEVDPDKLYTQRDYLNDVAPRSSKDPCKQ